jgi:hypothetical protein
MNRLVRAVGGSAVLAAMALSLVLFAPMPAHAAGELEVSLDGSAYSSSPAGSLFTDLARMVPGDEQQNTVRVRNAGTDAGYLRIVVGGVTYTDLDFANALTVQTVVAGAATPPKTPLSLAQPCWVLIEGITVAPGQVVEVDARAELGMLDGTRGQGATATATLTASLSDTTPGSLSPTDCGRPDISVPLTPPAGGNGTPATPVDPDGAASGGLVPGESAGDLPVLNLPGGITIDPNTWHLLEEWLVLFLFAALVLGAAWFAFVSRRRRKDGGEESIADTEAAA